MCSSDLRGRFLSRIVVQTPHGPVAHPAPPQRRDSYGPVPALGEHTESVRAEFRGTDKGSA